MSRCQVPAGVPIARPCRVFVQFDVDMLFSPGCLPATLDHTTAFKVQAKISHLLGPRCNFMK